MLNKIGKWLCSKGKHDREITDRRINYNMLTVKTKCKRCGKEEVLKKLV
ncbi:hypothetical protein vBBcePLY3_00020 [Bacillus phage vB_BceP_LY3]|uniref:Uncharacterized protein n=1 Tax=Bacillus phage vB_BceP_LY3 TaxID=2950458 RepID=A0AAE9LVE4_9CAUD|nr:hypothetical protein vBBcePLY3_00020 [Bacillus phage vB_BceP_LY3]